jgi:hypothetical protein
MMLEDLEASTSEPYIPTADGQCFYFDRPEEFDYSVDDIAPSLAKICRFNGRVRKFLSVAEHAVLVSYLVPKELAYTALHHDDVEAFIGDSSSPLKKLIPELRALARKIEPWIARSLGLIYPFPEEIHTADQIALGIESRDCHKCGQLRPIPERFKNYGTFNLNWEDAEYAYRARHREIGGKR